MLQTNQKDKKKTEYIALYCRVATINQVSLIHEQQERANILDALLKGGAVE